MFQHCWSQQTVFVSGAETTSHRVRERDQSIFFHYFNLQNDYKLTFENQPCRVEAND